MAPGAIAEALVSAASAGVDVRVLVPANNNWPLVGSFSPGWISSLVREWSPLVRMARKHDSCQEFSSRWFMVQDWVK